MQTMRRTVPAHGRLVLVPIPDDVAEADVLSAIGAFLEGHSGVPRCAALVTWSDDGGLFAEDIDRDDGDELPKSAANALRSALAALLTELFGTSFRGSWSGVDAGASATHVEQLSMSFLREVHDFVTPKTSFIALLTDWVDPGAIVRELRHLRGLRVIYGGVPSSWAANRA